MGPRKESAEKIFSRRSSQQLSTRSTEESFLREHSRRTTRESRVKSIKPSCSLDMSWSTLSFNAENISFGVADLATQIRDLQRDQTEFIVFRLVAGKRFAGPQADVVEVAADLLQRARARLEIIAASNSEAKIDAIEK